MATLTKKQRQVLEFIKNFVCEYGYAPSYEEIARGLGLSAPSTIHVHVENLRSKGFLTKKWNANRSIDLAEPTDSRRVVVEVPLAGRIAAGEPLEAVQDIETIGLPPDMVGRNQTFVLRVKGDSMIEDHVLDGDYVIVEKRPIIKDGDMVVALIRGTEATLKRLYKDRGRIRLQPANPAYTAKTFAERDVEVQGVVIGILRRLPG